MDIFDDVVRLHRHALVDAALRGLGDAGVLDALREGPRSAQGLADACGLVVEKLIPVLDALVAEELLTRGAGGEGAIYRESGLSAGREASPRQAVSSLPGWAELSSVLRTGRPAALPEHPTFLLRYHDHLVSVADAPARELAERLSAVDTLLDLGGGLGGYALPFLEAAPAARATILDAPAVIALARRALAGVARLELIEGDAADFALEEVYGAVLISNLLHLHDATTCARIVRCAASALAPGGRVVIKDLALEDDRLRPLAAVWFNVNMAVFTEGGAVHSAEALAGWLREAGLVDVQRWRLESSPGSLVVVASAVA